MVTPGRPEGGAHADVVELAAPASIPAINGLTDFSHRCEILGDLLTIKEKRRRAARKA